MEGGKTKATYIAVNSASQRVKPQGGGAWGYSPFKWNTGGKSAAVLVKPLPWTPRSSGSGSALTLNLSVMFGGLAEEKKAERQK